MSISSNPIQQLGEEFARVWVFVERTWLKELRKAGVAAQCGTPPQGSMLRLKTVVAAWYVNSCLSMITAARYETPARANDAFNYLALIVAPLLEPDSGFAELLEAFGTRPVSELRESFATRGFIALRESGWDGAVVSFPVLALMAVDLEFIGAIQTATVYGDEQTVQKNTELHKAWWDDLSKRS
jgi:hypothetical protein